MKDRTKELRGKFAQSQGVEQRYRTALDGMLEGCQIIDFDWRYVYLNDAAARHGRRPKKELLGHTMMEAYPGIEKTKLFKQLKRCMEKRVSHRLENEFSYPDGAKGWFELSFEPVEEGVFILSMDITERKQAEEKLRESEEKFRSIFELSPYSNVVLDLEGNIQLCNQRFVELHATKDGVEAQVGRNIDEFFPPEERARLSEAIERTIEEKKTIVGPVEYRALREDGGEVLIEGFSIVMVDKAGLPTGVLGLARDVTERRRAEEKLRESEELLNEVGGIAKIGGWEMDMITRKAKWTRATYDIVEIGYDDPIPGPDEHVEYYLPEYRPLVEDAMKKLIEDDIPLDFEAKLRTAKGNIIWCHAKGKAIREDGKCVKVRGTFQNITERKRAEKALKKWSEELENRVRQRTTELEQRSQELAEANVRLEEMSRHKSQFLANMSHELRTPLNSIIGYTKLMLDGMEGEISQEQRQDLQTVYNNSQSLLALINDLLDISKIEAGKVTLSNEAFTIAELLDDVMPAVKRLAEGKGLTLEYKVDPAINHLYADRAKTKQTLMNILANAIKFTEKGGIKLGVAQGDGEFIFSVSDTGLGIKKEDLKVIFDSFKQVGPAQIAGFEGTGLGLAISKQFVEMQGGRIWAESRLGKGSTFTFTLPKKKAPSP